MSWSRSEFLFLWITLDFEKFWILGTCFFSKFQERDVKAEETLIHDEFGILFTSDLSDRIGMSLEASSNH